MVELISNDRIVGGLTNEATLQGAALFSRFCQGEILQTDATTAELAKLAENAYRDVNIAFANELSMIANRLGVDSRELIQIANHHPRVNILQPGVGVGGHCIAVDPWFIVSAAPDDSNLIRAGREVNTRKTQHVIADIDRQLPVSGTIVFYGLTFKPNVDDVRNSPAIEVVEEIARRHQDRKILAIDPNVVAIPPQLAKHGNVGFSNRIEDGSSASMKVVLVGHHEFDEAGLPIDLVPRVL